MSIFIDVEKISQRIAIRKWKVQENHPWSLLCRKFQEDLKNPGSCKCGWVHPSSTAKRAEIQELIQQDEELIRQSDEAIRRALAT